MRWFVTRRGVLIAAVLAVGSVGWGALSSVLPEPARGIAVALFVVLVVVAVFLAARAQGDRWREEWRRGEGDD